MNVMLAEGLADDAYLAEYTDFDDGVRAHLAERTPEWAAEITGIDAASIADLRGFMEVRRRPTCVSVSGLLEAETALRTCMWPAACRR